MINKIQLTNFKCFHEETSFELSKVNIFTGYNGRGKSSVFQALLLLSQSYISKRNIEKLHLNGEWVNLGEFLDIINKDADDLDVKITLCSDEQVLKCAEIGFTASEDDMVGELKSCLINGADLFDSVGDFTSSEKNEKKTLLKNLPAYLTSLLDGIHFISANRLGPIKYVDKKEIPDYHRVGKNGDFSINTLASYKDSIKAEMNVLFNDNVCYSLPEATSKWISYIMDGGDMQLKGNTKDSSVLSVGFTGRNESFHFNAENVGFGYSYILSIVVTALVAKTGSIVIIENPEAHLHPAAQSRITALLSKLAERGVQVMIETHSEHILNGFRVNALDKDFNISNEDLSVYFFDKDFSNKKLIVGANGKIANWPEGFFNQQEIDLTKIMRLGAGR